MSKNRPNIAERIWARVIKEKKSLFNNNGEALLDPTPMAIPTGMSIPESLDAKLERLFRADHFRRQLAEQDLETFEESQDFGPDDDDDLDVPMSPYQRHASIAAMQAADRGISKPFPMKDAQAASERVSKAKAAAKSPKAIEAEAQPALDNS